MLEDLYGQVLAVQEEVDMAKCEGANVTKAKGRIDRAESLYKEAQILFEKRDFTMVKPKITAVSEHGRKGTRSTRGNPKPRINFFSFVDILNRDNE